ncbi:MAG: hypothetical protein ACRBB6_11195 [Neptuniibacter sp.]
MTSKGMNGNCVCMNYNEAVVDNLNLTLLSTIPNQKIYRCNKCHAFLSFTDDLQLWEVLLQGNVEEEIKNLYQFETPSSGVA